MLAGLAADPAQPAPLRRMPGGAAWRPWARIDAGEFHLDRLLRQSLRQKQRFETNVATGPSNAVIELAIETSTRQPSIAMGGDGELMAARQVSSAQATSANLIPAIGDLLAEHHVKIADIGLVTVASGPGSFTGLRIGITAAKTIAYGLSCGLAAVGTLEVIANQSLQDEKLMDLISREGVLDIWAVLDAQRGQWFAGRFSMNSQRVVESAAPIAIVDPTQLLASLSSHSVISGPALCKGWPKRDRLQVAAEDCWSPRAETLIRLGHQRKRQNKLVSPFELVPDYQRPSAAEEKLGKPT